MSGGISEDLKSVSITEVLKKDSGYIFFNLKSLVRIKLSRVCQTQKVRQNKPIFRQVKQSMFKTGYWLTLLNLIRLDTLK